MPPKNKKAVPMKSKPLKRKQEDDKGLEPASKAAKVSDSKPKLNALDFSSTAKDSSGKKWNFKISTWNVAGLRAWLKKEGLAYVKKEDPDIICFQETKCSEKKLPPEVKLSHYYTYWANGEKEGYSGVALYSKEKPLKVSYGIDKEEHDKEGRVITAEYDKFYVVTAYVPNAGQGLKTLSKRMSWDPEFRHYLKKLDEKKPVILCGDLNVAHNEIDLANPKTNVKSAGFTKEEREGMTCLLSEGFVDTFRDKYPDVKGAYTFWSYFNNARARNTGWRLDYFLVSERLASSVCDVVIRKDVFGSDHCPVTLLMCL